MNRPIPRASLALVCALIVKREIERLPEGKIQPAVQDRVGFSIARCMLLEQYLGAAFNSIQEVQA